MEMNYERGGGAALDFMDVAMKVDERVAFFQRYIVE